MHCCALVKYLLLVCEDSSSENPRLRRRQLKATDNFGDKQLGLQCASQLVSGVFTRPGTIAGGIPALLQCLSPSFGHFVVQGLLDAVPAPQ